MTDGSGLEGGACLDLPLVVVDKYFMATERFQQFTAKAICGHCAVQLACLTAAIEEPGTPMGIRGGEAATARYQYQIRYRAGEAATELAIEAISRQRSPPITNGSTLRAGHFRSVPLLREDQMPPRPDRRRR
jgi:hypothetical protein